MVRTLETVAKEKAESPGTTIAFWSAITSVAMLVGVLLAGTTHSSTSVVQQAQQQLFRDQQGNLYTSAQLERMQQDATYWNSKLSASPSDPSVPVTSPRADETLSYPTSQVSAYRNIGSASESDSPYDTRQKSIRVRSYTRRDGTFVQSYMRRPSSRRR